MKKMLGKYGTRLVLIIISLFIFTLVSAAVSYACIPTEERCPSRRYSEDCGNVDLGAGGRCICDQLYGSVIVCTCCINPPDRVCNVDCGLCRKLDYSDCKCKKVPDGTQDGCADTHYCIDGFCAPKPAPEECATEGEPCGTGQPQCCPGTTCDSTKHICMNIKEEPPERCYCEDNCNIFSECEMSPQQTGLLCPAEYCKYETPGQILDALINGEEVPPEFIIEVIGQISERLGSELTLVEKDDLIALIQQIIRYAESSPEEFEQIANELKMLLVDLPGGRVDFNISIPKKDECEFRLIETPDENNLFRTTYYMTAKEDDHDKWFANVTPYCPIDETKGFYEAVKCFGSGIGEGEKGYIYRHADPEIQPEKEISPYLDPAKGEICQNGVSATGTNPTPHRTVATDLSVVPKNSFVYIDWPDTSSVWEGYYHVEDTGGSFKGGVYRIDIYLGVGLEAAKIPPPEWGHVYQRYCNDMIPIVEMEKCS